MGTVMLCVGTGMIAIVTRGILGVHFTTNDTKISIYIFYNTTPRFSVRLCLNEKETPGLLAAPRGYVCEEMVVAANLLWF